MEEERSDERGDCKRRGLPPSLEQDAHGLVKGCGRAKLIVKPERQKSLARVSSNSRVQKLFQDGRFELSKRGLHLIVVRDSNASHYPPSTLPPFMQGLAT